MNLLCLSQNVCESSLLHISLIKSGSGCTVALESMYLEPSFMAHFEGLQVGLAEKFSKLRNSQTVAMEVEKTFLF